MTKTFTKAANGNTEKVDVNENFLLELEENPTTGYGWQIIANEGFKIVSSDFTLNTSPMVGSGGIRRFVLQVPAQGTFHLLLNLKHSWEDESNIIDSFEINIQAK